MSAASAAFASSTSFAASAAFATFAASVASATCAAIAVASAVVILLSCAGRPPAAAQDAGVVSPPAAAGPAPRDPASPAVEAEREPGAALELIRRGETALAAGDPQAALAAFERASAELGRLALYASPDPDAWGDAGVRIAAGAAEAYLRVGEPYLARLEAQRARNVDPSDSRVQVLLGTACFREGRFAEADAAFAEALRLDPTHGPAHAGRGLLELSANHLASARERFARAYAFDRDPENLWFLARIAFLERDYGGAADRLREYLDRARSLAPGLRDELRERARVYARLGDGRGSRFAGRVTRGQLRFDVARGDEVPLLPIRVNGGEPVYFLFDTGAQDHVLDATFARELGLELSPPAGSLETAEGAAERRVAVVDSLNLGGIVVESVPVSVADFGALGLGGRRSYHVAGVLSPALLFRDFLLRVDFRRRTIDLERYDAGGRAYAERPAQRRVSVPFRFNADGTGMIVEGWLAGTAGHPLLVDTGASDVYLSPAVGRVLDLDPLDVRIGLGDYRKERLRVHFLRGLGEGGEEGDLPGRGVAYEGILGFPFFRDMRVVLDYYHGVMLIES